MMAADSANYALEPAAFSAGGRASGGPYAQDGAFVSCGGASASSGGQVVARHGYAGQLADPKSIDIAVQPVAVPELTAAQFAAQLVYDDDTRASLDPGTVAWEIIDGPLEGISTGGLLDAGVVAQDTAATIHAEHAGVSGSLVIIVLNTANDNFGMYSGDGVDDAWQVEHFGLDNPLAQATADPDGDDQDNHFEWTAGLDPLDPHGRFNLRMEPDPNVPARMTLVFSPLVAGRTYRVLHGLRPDEIGTPLDAAATTDSGNTRTVTDLDVISDRRFYRVEISNSSP